MTFLTRPPVRPSARPPVRPSARPPILRPSLASMVLVALLSGSQTGCIILKGPWRVATCDELDDGRLPHENDTISFGDPGCTPDLQLVEVEPLSPWFFPGRTVSFVRFGSDSLQSRFTDAVMGTNLAYSSPYIQFRNIDRSDGVFSTLHNHVTGPSGSGLGDQVHAVDLFSAKAFTSGPYAEGAMGQEVLIAAPASSEVYVGVPYFLGGDGSQRQEYTWLSTPAYSYGIPDNDARISFAAPATAPTYPTSWVAVGFAHMSEVHILTPGSTWAGTDPPALTFLDGVGITGATRFGWSMVVADFDEDGLQDLAVGAPGPGDGSGIGAVHVYFGCGTACTGPLDFTSPVVITHTIAQHGDRFGASLAAGRLGGQPKTSLVVGAPGWNNGSAVGAGSVCWVSLLGRSGSVQCAANPLPESDSAGDAFGHAVAVANVSSSDRYGLFDTELAELEELVVSAPQSVGPAGVIVGVPYMPATSDPGVVYVFRSTLDDGPVVSSVPFDLSSAYLKVLRPPVAMSSGGFGEALAVGEAKGLPMPNGRPDLLIGDGMRFRVYLTEHDAVNGFMDDRTGLFTGPESRPWRVFADRSGRVGFLSLTDFTKQILGEDDEECAEVDFIDSHLHFPSVSVAVDESEAERCFAQDSNYFDITFTHESTGDERKWQLEFEPEGCDTEEGSIELVRTEEIVCEP